MFALCATFIRLNADEHSEDEEPATTSADDEATKKASTEQQKQLSKKVSMLFSSATHVRGVILIACSIQTVWATQLGRQPIIRPIAAILVVKPYCLVYVAT